MTADKLDDDGLQLTLTFVRENTDTKKILIQHYCQPNPISLFLDKRNLF